MEPGGASGDVRSMREEEVAVIGAAIAFIGEGVAATDPGVLEMALEMAAGSTSSAAPCCRAWRSRLPGRSFNLAMEAGLLCGRRVPTGITIERAPKLAEHVQRWYNLLH